MRLTLDIKLRYHTSTAMTSIILAGGSSTRLGRDKASEVLAGASLLQHVLQRMSSISREVLLVLKPGQRRDVSAYGGKVRVVYDDPPGRGPLGGLYTGLKASADSYVWAVGCDMPFLNVGLLKYQRKVSDDFDAVVPRLNGLESLHAVYSRTCIPQMESLLNRREVVGIHRLFPLINVRYVEKEEVLSLDPEARSFFNVNSEADLRLAQEYSHHFQRGSNE